MNARKSPKPQLPLVEARLSPPAVPPLRLRREGLCGEVLKRLDGPASIVSILAPAGHGKTSLLRLLHAECVQRSRAVAWLSLADDAGDAEQLLAYLVASLARAGLSAAGGAAPPTVSALLNALARLPEPVVLLVDQLERLQRPDGLHALQLLLDVPTPGLRVVLAGRHNPGLRLSGWLAARRLTAIEPAELAFSFAETTDYVIGECKESPGAVALSDIHERSEGWPGLLSLMIASLPRDATLENAVRDGLLPRRQVAAYVAEEVLSGLPDDDRQALEVLALAGVADERLMRHVHADSTAPSLDALAARNPLVRTRGADRYALHPVVRDSLRSHLAAEAPARFRALSARLAEWAGSQKDAATAIDRWIDAGDAAQAGALLEAEGRNIALEGFPNRCLDWLDRLHATHLERHPGLQLTEVWARVTMHETTATAALLASQRLKAAQRRNAALDIEVKTATAFSHAISDHVEAAAAAVAAVPDEARQMSAVVNAGCASVFAWTQFVRGEFDGARRTLYQSGALDMQGQGLLTHAYAAVVSGECDAAEGRMQSAETILRRAVKLAEDRRGRRSMVVVVTLGPLLEVLYERDQIDEVLALASGREHLRLKYSTPGSSTAAGVALAHSLMLRDAAAEAREMLDDMLRVGEESRLPRIVAHALATRIQFALREGRSHELAELVGRLDALRDDAAGLLSSPQGVINYWARVSALRIAAGRGSLAAARRDAAALAAELKPLPWLRMRLSVDTLAASLAWQAGDAVAAVEALIPVLVAGAERGLIRSIVDALADSALLDAPELRKALPAPLLGYLDRLKGAMAVGVPVPAGGHRMLAPGSGWTDATLSGAKAGFTAREREILFLLARDIATKRIAQTLRISPETAKWHTRNIYEKLGVHDRASARMALQRLQMTGDGGRS
ncbi:MAG: hypothetical protein C0434_05885 [Xanthomonadaceae bacterium]|nr:hypothetical protein [Xanthomonadaceae bacterium]